MSELYIPPERFERDFITGRFLKGCVSHKRVVKWFIIQNGPKPEV